MNSLYDDENEFNNLLRLKSLMNLGTKKRDLPTNDPMDILAPDLSGTENMPPMMPPEMASPAGGTANYGGYDVRANEVVKPPSPNMYERMAGGFSKMMTNMGLIPESSLGAEMPPMEDPYANEMRLSSLNAPVEENEMQLPPELKNEILNQPASAGVPQMKSAFNNEMPAIEPEMPGTSALAPPPLDDEQKQIVQERAALNASNQTVSAIPNATDVAIQDPQILSELKRLTGLNYTPEEVEQIKRSERAADEYTTALSDEEALLREKIQNRDLSTTEKVFFAAALLAPILISSFMGKGAAFATAGGVLKGVAAGAAGGLKKREDALARITDINKEKFQVQQKREEMLKKINDSSLNKELRPLVLQNKFVDNGKLLIDTGNPDLPLKSTAIRTIHDYNRITKDDLPKMAEKVANRESAAAIADNLMSLLSYAIKEQENGNVFQKVGKFINPLYMYDIGSGLIKRYMPSSRDEFVDEFGNKVKIDKIYSTLRSEYLKTFMSESNTKAQQDFSDQMLPNSFESWWTSVAHQDSISQLDALERTSNEKLYRELDQKGFDSKFVKDKLSKSSFATEKKEKVDVASKQKAAKEALKDPNNRKEALAGNYVQT